ncbi:MAG: hypothetical protein C5B50_02995 [Verrucomicrobia bacterium]|nr:MAG: hypothetical protein C5B50_02995 [Verrucomicrobiota bacterium]
MNQPGAIETVSTTQHQHAWRARFFTRLQRLRGLLLAKWWIPALGVALGVGIQASRSITEKPSYVSTGRMIVSMKLSIPEGQLYTEEMGNFLGTQAALMQSDVVIHRAHLLVIAQNPNFKPQPVSLKVTILPKTTIFLLVGTGDDPVYTQKFLQACMEEYANLKAEMRTQTSDKTLSGLSEEVESLRKELKQSSVQLEAFQGSNSVVVLDQQGNSAGNYLTALNQRLAGLKSELELLRTMSVEQTLERRQQGGGVLPAPEPVADVNNSASSSLSANDSSQNDYFKAKQQIALMEAQKQDWSEFLRPKHPKMVALDEDISRRRRLLGIFKDQSSEQLQTLQKTLELQIANMERDVREWDAKCLEISRKTAEYQRLKNDSQRVQGLYDRLLATMQTLDVNKQINPESVTIYEKATQAYPDRVNLPMKLALGAVAGLGLSLLVMLFVDRLDDRMASFTELQELFDEEILAQIPREGKAREVSGLPLITQNGSPHSFVEAYRNLRSSLLYMGNGSRPRTLLITSSAPGEGKSLTAENLGAILANTGSRVLLVDGDLRKGVLHSRFGLDAMPGLTEVLADGKPVRDVIRETTIPNLWLLPRGSTTHHSSELFISQAAADFLKNAAMQYDYVIMDTAPVMAADDVASLAPNMDSTIFLVRAEHTSARVARAALDILYQRRVKVMGLVFNAVRPTTADYYYSKYSEYYRTYPGKG